MSNNEKNRNILEQILNLCDEIVETLAFFGDSFEIFDDNPVYKNTISACLLQISELSGHLSNGFKETYTGVSWRNIQGVKEIMDQEYGDISDMTVWETITCDIPILLEYCKNTLEELPPK